MRKLQVKKTRSRPRKAKRLSSRNARLLRVLDEIMSQSDDHDAAFWEEFQRDLRGNRMKLRSDGG